MLGKNVQFIKYVELNPLVVIYQVLSIRSDPGCKPTGQPQSIIAGEIGTLPWPNRPSVHVKCSHNQNTGRLSVLEHQTYVKLCQQ